MKKSHYRAKQSIIVCACVLLMIFYNNNKQGTERNGTIHHFLIVEWIDWCVIKSIRMRLKWTTVFLFCSVCELFLLVQHTQQKIILINFRWETLKFMKLKIANEHSSLILWTATVKSVTVNWCDIHIVYVFVVVD